MIKESILIELGLTQQEIKVYLALWDSQEAQSGKICKQTKIASSNIYYILDSLIQKGLVSYRIQNNIKMFMPAPPETLNELFLEKQKIMEENKKEITQFVSQLKKLKIEPASKSQYKYYEGITGIKSLWHDLNDQLTVNSICYYYTTKKSSYERFVGFYTEHHELRKKQKAKGKMIFPLEDKELAKQRTKLDPKFESKFLGLDNDAEWGVIDENFYLQYIKGKVPRGFLIQDQTFAKTMASVFEKLWKTAQK